MSLSLSSKARTLQDLSKVITKAKVLPLIRFNAIEYERKRDEIIRKVLEKFSSNLIVRSSSNSEDATTISNAGKFDTVLNVKPNFDDIDRAILKVKKSFNLINKDDEIFIQPMLQSVQMAGVVFSADVDTLSPYYIINYDNSGSTTSVTNGKGKNLKTFIAYKNLKFIDDKNILKLLEAVKECEGIFKNLFLDIEFAFHKDELYILQVRPIVTINKDVLDINLNGVLEKLYKEVQTFNKKHPFLLGQKTIFGVMPDWNPAEIIGIKPKRLAISLYKELITDNIWAYQRDNYGYRNLRSFPLLVSFAGVPFIDVRVSFNSFIPKDLDKTIAEKLVNFYLDKLLKNRVYHDKVEFEIVYSCYFFGIDKKLKKLLKFGFNKNEIKRIEFSLLELTNGIIKKDGLYKKDIQKIEILKNKYEAIVDSNLTKIEKIYWLIEDCKRYGALPFAGVARAAFIAVQFLKSMVDEDIITQNEYNRFMNSLKTISRQISIDKIKLSREEFLKNYGHLRPGTYDITSKRYDERYDEYFGDMQNEVNLEKFDFSKEQIKELDRLLRENGIKINAYDFTEFLKEAIEAREYLKFIFTKSLSKVLELIAEFGESYGFSKEDLAYLDIQEILNLYATFDHKDAKDILKFDIDKNREFYKFTKAVKLPSLIADAKDIYRFYLEEDEPTFVTLKSIIAEVENDLSKNIKDKIVCIKSADPGYDFLFSKQIAGLITCYGGGNSHMAVRCAELGVVAVIGCGESNFKRYKNAKKLKIDTLNKQVVIL